MVMKFILQNGLLLLMTYTVISCGSAKKLDFDSAYKFSRYNYNKSEVDSIKKTRTGFSTDELTVSLQPTDKTNGDMPMSSLEENFYRELGLPHQEAKNTDIIQLKQSYETLSQGKRRELRKELKKEVKEFRKEIKDISSAMEMNRSHEMSELMRWSIIIGSVGLVLLLLGAIFSGILTFFGPYVPDQVGACARLDFVTLTGMPVSLAMPE
jgi:hypothetical protein